MYLLILSLEELIFALDVYNFLTHLKLILLWWKVGILLLFSLLDKQFSSSIIKQSLL